MVSPPSTHATGNPPGDALDSRREASMADEGGWSAALIETEEPAPTVAEPAPSEVPLVEESEPPPGGPRRFRGSLARGAAVAIAKLMARARRYAARRAQARVHGH